MYQIGAGTEGGPLIFPLLTKEGVRRRLLSGGLRSDLGDLRARQVRGSDERSRAHGRAARDNAGALGAGSSRGCI